MVLGSSGVRDKGRCKIRELRLVVREDMEVMV